MRLPGVLRTPRLRSAAAPFAANGALYGAWTARIPEIQSQTALSEGDLGLALLGGAIGLAVSASTAGLLVDRFGAHRVTLLSLVVFSMLVMAPGFATGFASLAVALVLVGMGGGLLDVAMNTWGADVETASERPLLGTCHGLFSLGMMVGAGLSALAAWADVPLALHFGMSGLVFGGTAFLQGWRIREAHTPSHPETTSPMLALPTGPIAGLAALSLFGLVVEGAMADWSAVFLRNVLAASDETAALGMTAFAGCMAAARFGTDALTARIGDIRLVRAGAVLGLVGLVTCIVAPAVPIAIAGFGLVGLGFSGIVPALFRAASKVPALAPGTGIAAVASMGYLGLMGGPPAIGFLADAYGLREAFGGLVMLAALIALGAGAAFRLARPRA